MAALPCPAALMTWCNVYTACEEVTAPRSTPGRLPAGPVFRGEGVCRTRYVEYFKKPN